MQPIAASADTAVPAANPPGKARGEIRTLQYGRGIAALLVCLFHFNSLPEKYLGAPGADWLFRAGHSGVEFFFVLSGYIIYRAHEADLGRSSRVTSFYLKRAIRILPAYWFVVIPVGLAMLLVPSLGADRNLSFGKFLTDLVLIPRAPVLTLTPAWTLQHEVIFYVVFGVLILNFRAGLLTLVAWQTACVVALVSGLLPQDYLLPASKIFGFYNFGFLFGIAIGVLDRRRGIARYGHTVRPLATAALLALIFCFYLEWKQIEWQGITNTPAVRTLAYFAIYSAIMLFLLSVKNRPRPALNRTLGVLGGASYMLYVLHEPLQSALFKVLLSGPIRPYVTPLNSYVISILFIVTAAVLLHQTFERPVLSWLAQRLLKR